MEKRWLMRVGTVQLMLIVTSVILGVLFFVQIEIDSDMSGAIVDLYKKNMYLGREFQWTKLSSYTPWNVALWISYSIFGLSEKGVKCIVTIFFTVCCFMTLELGLDNYEKDGLTAIPVIFFMLIPGIATNKYHYTSTIVILSVLLFLKKREDIPFKVRRLADITVGIIFLWLLSMTVDKMLIFLNVLCPIILYHLNKSIREKKNLDKTCCCGLGVILLFFVWYLYSLGHSDASIQLYGAGSYYLSWADFADMWSVGIEFLIKTVVRAMNISAVGPIVQPMTLVWIIKILLIAISIVSLIKTTRRILKNIDDDLGNIYLVIICGAVILSALFYMANGVRIGLYKTYGYSYSYCGYMGIVWFLLPLLAAEYVKSYVKKAESYRKLLEISVWAGCGMLSVMSMLECVSVLTNGYSNINKQTADYLVEIGAEGGLATYEAYYATVVWSGGKVYPVGYVYTDTDEESRWAYRRFDTYIEWKTNNKGPDVVEQDVDRMLTEKYGSWAEKQKFCEDETRTYQSDYPQERLVYFYNRDIRWSTREVDVSDGHWDARIYLPLGQNRVQLTGSGLADIELQFWDTNGKLLVCEKEYTSDTHISYLVTCPYSNDVEVRFSDTDAMIDRIYLDVNRAAIRMSQDIGVEENESVEMQTELPVGEYVFILIGENLENIELASLEEAAEIEVYQNGKGRKIYFCTVKDSCPIVTVVNTGNKKADIENVYYELTFEERSALIEELRE